MLALASLICPTYNILMHVRKSVEASLLAFHLRPAKHQENGNDEESPVSAGDSAPAQSIITSRSTDVLDTSPAPGSGRVTDSASGRASDADSQRFKDKGLSTEVIVSIVIPIVAMIAAIIVTWWKRHQVLWCLTCGVRGDKHSSKSVSRDGPSVSQMGRDTDARHPSPPSTSNHVYVINGVTHINQGGQSTHRMHDEASDRSHHESLDRMHHGPPSWIYPLALEDCRWDIQHCEASLILTRLIFTWWQSFHENIGESRA